MQAAVKKPLKEDIVSMGGMIGGESKKLHALREQGKNICGDVVSKAIAYAVGVLEVNASMGLIVAAPTAGSSGVIPGTSALSRSSTALPMTRSARHCSTRLPSAI